MKVSKSTANFTPVNFNDLQKNYLASMNRVYGITKQSVRSQFPVGCHSKNQFKTKQDV